MVELVTADEEQCSQARWFEAIDHAFRHGHFELLPLAVDDRNREAISLLPSAGMLASHERAYRHPYPSDKL